MNNITIGYCSKEDNPRYASYIRKIFGDDVEIIEKHGDMIKTISVCYNEIINESSNDIIILMHDDLEFISGYDNYVDNITKVFENNPEFGILGVIGGAMLNDTKPRWSNGESYMKGGIILQGDSSAMHRKDFILNINPDMMIELRNNSTASDINNILSRYPMFNLYSDKIIETVVMDGLFFIIDRRRIKRMFDESNPTYHFYDLDFCFSNHLAGCKVGISKMMLIKHNSHGVYNEEFTKGMEWFKEKHKYELPYIGCGYDKK